METRSAQHPVLLVTADPQTTRAVSEALASNGHFVPGDPCRDLRELETALERRAVRGVLIDLDPEPATTLAELNPIIARFSTTRFIVLSGTYNADWVLAAMQIGARHFLLKQAIEAELCEALNRLIPPADEVATGSAVVTVLGARRRRATRAPSSARSTTSICSKSAAARRWRSGCARRSTRSRRT